MIKLIKDCSDRDIVKIDWDRTPGMRTNRHYTSSGHVKGWIDFGGTTLYWSDEPYSSFTQDDARALVKQWKEEHK